MSRIEVITTGDGSHSLVHTGLNETYHSVHGALRESVHVFIKNGLDFFCDQSPADPIRILEIGFGTGLNAMLAAARAEERKRRIHYTTLEAFPLEENIWRQLNYGDGDEQRRNSFEQLHRAPWSEEVSMSRHFTILKSNTTLQQAAFTPSDFDVVFFDAFAPSKQPELWDIALLAKVAKAMKSRGVFVTYCAKGQLKRDLKDLNLAVQTLVGPPGKKEMVRALKN